MEGRSNGSTSRNRRSRGRPAAEDAAGLRDQILDEAEARFARQGYAATSLRKIADAVDVNPAMVHYYFGSKQDLLRQVMDRVLEPLGEALAGMRASGKTSPGDIVRLLSGVGRRHPNLPLLMMREVMLPGGVMQEYFLERLAPRLGGALPGIFRKEQAEGRLPQDLDPNILALLTMALSLFPFIVRDVAEPALGIDYGEEGLDALQSNALRILDRGITP